MLRPTRQEHVSSKRGNWCHNSLNGYEYTTKKTAFLDFIRSFPEEEGHLPKACHCVG